METQTAAQTLQDALITWFNQLASTDLSQKLHLLETKFNELPYQHLSPEEWFCMLELFLPVIKSIGDDSQTFYEQPNNLSAIERFHQFSRCQNLLLQLAMAYGVTINRTLFEENTVAMQQLQCNALQRAMHLLLQVQYHCYGAYHPMPINLWSCLHQFYFLSEKKQLLRKKPEFQADLSHSTIDELYKEALLLATAQLNQLQPSHLKEALTLIPSWVNDITLTTSMEDNNYYHIHLDLDEPPLYTSLEQGMTDPVTTRFFHCQTVLQQLNNLENTETKAHLQKAWQGFHIRQKPRINQQTSMSLCYGFQQAYLSLQEQKEIPSEVWQITNSSANGFHLENMTTSTTTLAPETLVTYKNPAFSTFDVWSIGMVRWLKQLSSQNIEMGMEILAHSALSVEVAHVKGSSQPGILLLGSLVKKRPNSIIFPINHPWKENDILEVRHPKLEITISLTFPCDGFSDSEQFEYELLEKKQNTIGWRHITYQDIENDGSSTFFPKI